MKNAVDEILKKIRNLPKKEQNDINHIEQKPEYPRETKENLIEKWEKILAEDKVIKSKKTY